MTVERSVDHSLRVHHLVSVPRYRFGRRSSVVAAIAFAAATATMPNGVGLFATRLPTPAAFAQEAAPTAPKPDAPAVPAAQTQPVAQGVDEAR